MKYIVGIDVGGTNTDAVILNDELKLVAEVKSPTTLDVSTGINNALRLVLHKAQISPAEIKYAMLGTTHATNAIVERKKLCKVGIIRLGKPATESIEPMTGWPIELREAVGNSYYIIEGGHEFDGREIASIKPDEIRKIGRELAGKVESLAIISVFSPINAEHEKEAGRILSEELDIPISYSYEIGSLGLLERENATILNAALTNVAEIITTGFLKALGKEGINNAAVYICQNDGTLMGIEYAHNYPILTIACGPTNSIRGASALSKIDSGIVLDIGGTTSDIGIINKGFPRESSMAVEIGGVRTNFRMPDLISIGLGGGTIIKIEADEIKVGPESVGYRINEESRIFGGKTITATDIAVRLGICDIGDRKLVEDIPLEFAKKAHAKIMEMIEVSIDKMKISKDPLPLVLVGGGSIIVSDNIAGVEKLIHPDNFGIANAFGAAISQVSGEVDKLYSLAGMSREEAIEDAVSLAVNEAVKAGAEKDTITIVNKEDIPLAYLPGNSTRIRVKAAGLLEAIN